MNIMTGFPSFTKKLMSAAAVGVLLASPAIAEQSEPADAQGVHTSRSDKAPIEERQVAREQPQATTTLEEDEASAQLSKRPHLIGKDIRIFDAGEVSTNEQLSSINSDAADAPSKQLEGRWAPTEVEQVSSTEDSLEEVEPGTAKIKDLQTGTVYRIKEEPSIDSSGVASAGAPEDSAALQPLNEAGATDTMSTPPAPAPANGADGVSQQQSQDSLANPSAALEQEELSNINSLLGASVANASGESLGSVEEVVINHQNGEAGLVLFVEQAQALVLAPVEELSQEDSGLVWRTPLDAAEIAAEHSYDGEGFERLSSVSESEQSDALTQL